MSKPKLALFDLDHTLIDGDSDVLWCDFLMEEGLLDRKEFAARNADMEARYKAGTVGVAEFAGFYVSTLAGRTRTFLEPVRHRFLREWVVPRTKPAAADLVREHLDAGDLVVMTTATNRYITELTARHFGIEHVLATETGLDGDAFTGAPVGTLNMRDGKVVRLHAWLQQRGQSLADFDTTAYSDSVNDLPLLESVDHAVAVDPDTRLAAIAHARGWRTLYLLP